MSRPRHVVPGKLSAVSRRTTRRHFVLNPDSKREVENAFWYCVIVTAQKHGISVHSACLMSTHLHLVETDMLGRAPDFYRDFHRLFALCMKAFRGWPEEVFNKSSTSEVELLTAEAVIESIAYTLVQGVEAFAVRYHHQWPGAMTRLRDLGRRVIHAKKPHFYFRGEQWPEDVRMKLTLPTLLLDTYGEEDTLRRIAVKVHDLEKAAWQKAKKAGAIFKGVKRVLRQKHTQRARSYEKFSSRNPQFKAAGNIDAAREAIGRYRHFRAAYAKSLSAWKDGRWNEAVFPYGTWSMRVHHNARCHPPP